MGLLNEHWLDTPDLILNQIRLDFRDQGYVVVNSLLNADAVTEARNEYQRLLGEWFEAPVTTNGTPSIRIPPDILFNAWQNSEVIREFVCSPELACFAARLIDADSLRLLFEEMLFKTGAHNSQISWHRDCEYAPISGDDLVMAFIPLVALNEESGLPLIAVDSHIDPQPVLDEKLSDRHRVIINQELVRLVGYRIDACPTYQPGDVLFIHGSALHASNPNTGGQARESIGITYARGGTTILKPVTGDQKVILGQTMRGLRPGDKLSGPLHPVLWSRGDTAID